MKEKMTKWFKGYVRELGIFVRGFLASVLGFANVVSILFGLNCFTQIKSAESWYAIGYFFGMIAMIAIFLFITYMIGVGVKKIFRK